MFSLQSATLRVFPACAQALRWCFSSIATASLQSPAPASQHTITLHDHITNSPALTSVIRSPHQYTDNVDAPPLIIFGGTSQVVASYRAHVTRLAASLRRDVLCVALRGQGGCSLR